MKDKDLMQYCLDALNKAGAEKGQCRLAKTEKYEINIDSGEFSLIRSTSSSSLGLTAIKDKRKGSITINKIDNKSISDAVIDVINIANSSQPDDNFDISPYQESKVFHIGDNKPDKDKMFSFLNEFKDQCSEKFPYICLNQVVFSFNYTEIYFANSNGTLFNETKGYYEFSSRFNSKKDKKTTSFNLINYFVKELKDSIISNAGIATQLKQSQEHLNAQPFRGKFSGDLLITPQCLDYFIQTLVRIGFSEQSVFSGSSIYINQLNKLVASSLLTIHSDPLSDNIAKGYAITPDGYEAKNTTLIQNGILKSYLVSQYGSNKTGIKRSSSAGGAYIIDSGNKELLEMIKGIKKGLLIGRFSGGNPTGSGDFSGIAKNSFYIEDGKIQYPVSETMISGNLISIFKQIKAISKERINSGTSILPWILSDGITISGK